MAKKASSTPTGKRGRGRPRLERPDYTKADPAHIAECADKIRPLLLQRMSLDETIVSILKDYEKTYSVDPVALKHSVALELKSSPKRLEAERRKAASLWRRHHYLEVLEVVRFESTGQGTFLSAA